MRYRVVLALAYLLMLTGCFSSRSVGPLTYDKEGNAYSTVELTTQYEVLCTGTCPSQTTDKR